MKILCSRLGLNFPPPDDIRYQLLHRTASALLEGKRFGAKYAVMLVHSFSPTHEWFDDYARFLSLFGTSGVVNDLSVGGTRSDIDLFFAWVRGDERYLKI
ncbi:MAG: DUF6946 family protein [Candidatus Hodarchaeota archaeon]